MASNPYEYWDNSDEPTPDPGNAPDTAIVPYVEALREAGITTTMSCQGHHNEEESTGQPGFLTWFDSDRFDPHQAVESGGFTHVTKLYDEGRLEKWQLVFPGFSWPEGEGHGESFDVSMKALFNCLGVDLPEEHPVTEPDPPLEGYRW